MASARAARRIIEAVIASEAKIPYRRGRKAWIASSQELLAMTRRQRRLLTLSLRPRRSPTAARGGGSSLPPAASPAQQSNPPHERKRGMFPPFVPPYFRAAGWQAARPAPSTQPPQSISRHPS